MPFLSKRWEAQETFHSNCVKQAIGASDVQGWGLIFALDVAEWPMCGDREKKNNLRGVRGPFQQRTALIFVFYKAATSQEAPSTPSLY